MEDRTIRKERAQNLWGSFARKFDPVARSTEIDPLSSVSLDDIGGLAGACDEMATYSCAITSPGVYERWGTYPPSGLLLIGRHGTGKRLLAAALANLTDSAFIRVRVPRLVIEIIHRGGNVAELAAQWSQTLSEMPPTTVFFDELEFSQAQEIGSHRPDLPIGPVMDFLLDILDRTIEVPDTLVVGATSHPSTLRQAFVQPGRLERIVEVTPSYPDDIVAALMIHAARSEQRSGHSLFDSVEWKRVVEQYKEPSTGEWIHMMHSVLRRKARCDAANETSTPVTTNDLLDEVERHKRANNRLATPDGGNYV